MLPKTFTLHDPLDQQQISALDSFLGLISTASLRFSSGQYTGDGTIQKTLFTGFQPKLLIISKLANNALGKAARMFSASVSY